MVGGVIHIVCSAWNVVFSWVSALIGMPNIILDCGNLIFNIINAVLGWG